MPFAFLLFLNDERRNTGGLMDETRGADGEKVEYAVDDERKQGKRLWEEVSKEGWSGCLYHCRFI